MSNIAEIDKNFKIISEVKREGVEFYNIDNPPFTIYGIYRDGDVYRRMPEQVAKSVSDGVYKLHTDTAGGRVRFKTDSRNIYIIVKYQRVGKMSHFAFTGSIGFDLYVKEDTGYNYIKSFVPPVNITDGFESVIDLKTNKLRDITINFPLYSSVKELLIGIDEGSVLLEGDEYTNKNKLVYYGSSITQGGCASRPGTCYQGHICRRFDCDYINLGFSGNAKAEQEMIDYICSLDMDLFIYDYDHNAPNIEHLINTHDKMYKQIRNAFPNLPIIMMTAPCYKPSKLYQERSDLIRKNYENAVLSGDKNVYFIDGPTLMAVAKNEGTVDNCHPTDLGFYSMACALEKVIEKIFDK